MYAFYASELSKQQMYKFLIGSVVPRPIALITSQSEEGLLNIAPFSFFNIVSSEPALLSVAVNRKEGAMKDTARNILTTKEAVVHVVTEANVANANQTLPCYLLMKANWIIRHLQRQIRKWSTCLA